MGKRNKKMLKKVGPGIIYGVSCPEHPCYKKIKFIYGKKTMLWVSWSGYLDYTKKQKKCISGKKTRKKMLKKWVHRLKTLYVGKKNHGVRKLALTLRL